MKVFFANIADAQKYGGFIRSDGVYVAHDGNEWPDWHRGCSDCLFEGNSKTACLILAEKGNDKSDIKSFVHSIQGGNNCQYYGMRDFQSNGNVDGWTVRREIERVASQKGL